ncbi:DUF3990 domain-containing protein [Flavobacterium psychrotrophum]|uniref:DUF3990 domain-containing protein n=1 Tax=Flavobacterium psychrotrophum TaxID=2294119 RepID=UPI000E31F0CB|nr:DUF3990 domain-containing protein [Flavobacterium psychrotrophum]
MDNISYHGTSSEFAESIVGPPSNVDLTLGKGELGKGFYTGSSIALAAIWARSRYEDQGVVIEFEIPKANFVQLKGLLIKTQHEVVTHWETLKLAKKTKKFKFEDIDYVVAPFATVEHTGNQFKFESKKAEDELNSSNKIIYPCVS